MKVRKALTRGLLILALIPVFLIEADLGFTQSTEVGQDKLGDICRSPLTHPKMDSILCELAAQPRESAAASALERSGIDVVGDMVRVVLEARPGLAGTVAASAQGLGARVETTFRDMGAGPGTGPCP